MTIVTGWARALRRPNQPQGVQDLRSKSGSLAMFAAIRRTSSAVFSHRGVRNGSKSGQASAQHEQSQTAAKK